MLMSSLSSPTNEPQITHPLRRPLMTAKPSKKVDKALDATFPASDPPALGDATGTEEPRRPADREAPLLGRKRGTAASKEQDGAGRKRHRGVGREGLSPSDHVSPPGDDQGLGHEGAMEEHPVTPSRPRAKCPERSAAAGPRHLRHTVQRALPGPTKGAPHV